MMDWPGGMVGFGWGGMFFGLLVWILLIALVLWAVASLFPRPRQQDDALETLKRRYARGELSEAEYGKARELLR